MTDLHTKHYASSWESFWQGSTNSNQKNASMPCFGGQARNLLHNWEMLLQPYADRAVSDDVVVDVAAGDGVVTYGLLQLLNKQVAPVRPQLFCTDYSLSACIDARSRDSHIKSVCTKAELLPFASETVNLVLSQFGIEYSGESGFIEALRVLKPQGQFIAVCHIEDGIIYNECKTHHSASLNFYESGIFATAEKVFKQANLVLEGRASKDTFVEADRAFSESVNTCKQVFAQYGKAVCANYLFKIFTELGQMFNSIQKYHLTDVLRWLENSRNELRAYAERMESMTKAALNEAEINQIFSSLSSRQPQIKWCYRPLMQDMASDVQHNENALPIAWVIEMTKL